MNWRSIACSALLAAATACAEGGSRPPAEDATDASEAIKISFYRSYDTPNAATKRNELVPTYRVVMSETWQRLVGESPREPFPKAAPKPRGRIYVGFQPDPVMKRYVAKLKELGVDKLQASETESYKPLDLFNGATNPAEAPFTRIFTVGTDKGHKSYYYRDQQGSKETIEIFLECERFVERVVEYSFYIETYSEPFERFLKPQK